MKAKKPLLYRGIHRTLRRFYPDMQILGAENLPDEPAVVVGNHSQIHGPLCCEFSFPRKQYTWCAGQMMHLKDVPAYAYRDFWSEKPRRSRWLFKATSYAIAPLSVLIFNNAHTIGVYHDSRIISTFRQTVQRLQQGCDIIIFPEQDLPHNHIVYEFQTRFVDIAKMYYKRTGKCLRFVPMYIAPNLKCMCIGKPITFCADAPIETERRRICDYLMQQITDIACSLPAHTVVPYKNLPRKKHPSNIPQKVTEHEKTRR